MSTRITKKNMRKTRMQDVRRLARWIGLRDIDKMSDRHLIRLLDWYFKRPEKRNMGWIL